MKMFGTPKENFLVKKPEAGEKRLFFYIIIILDLYWTKMDQTHSKEDNCAKIEKNHTERKSFIK